MTKYVYCLITILFALSGNIYSQNAITGRNFDPEIMKNSYYKNGIYSDIDQFFSNSPEHEFQLSVRGNRLMYLDENNNKFRQYTNPHWGVCINNQIYVKNSGKYVLVQPTGRFSFFLNHMQMLYEKGIVYEGSPFTRPALKNIRWECFIDFKANKRYRLNTFNVKNLLRNEDKVLYDEFMRNEHKKYFLKEYIVKLNNKYAAPR